MRKIAGVVLAAGKGTRMKSNLVKALHPLMGVPMLSFLLESLRKVAPELIVIVAGYQGEEIRERFKGQGLVFVEQEDQLGTGHAVLCAREALKDFEGDVLLFCGDVPLIRESTIRGLIVVHRQDKAKVTVLTTRMEKPEGYGRIIRGDKGEVLRIVEERDASDLERQEKEINTGIYCVDAGYLFNALGRIGRKNRQAEYYLTDIVAIAAREKEKVMGFVAEDSFEVMGINNRKDLARVNVAIRKEIIDQLMMKGVGIIDPHTTFIDRDVRIGKDTIVFPNCHLLGSSVVGEGCVVEPGCVIRNSEIGDRVIVKAYCVITDSKLAEEVRIGPFAHLRPGTELEARVKIGSFVEVKQ